MWQIVSDKSDELGQKCFVFLAFLLTTPNKFVKMFLTIFLLCHISLVHAVGNSYSLVGVIIFKINIFINIQTFHMHIIVIYIYIYITQCMCMFSLSITTYFITSNKDYNSCCNSYSMYQTYT